MVFQAVGDSIGLYMCVYMCMFVHILCECGGQSLTLGVIHQELSTLFSKIGSLTGLDHQVD